MGLESEMLAHWRRLSARAGISCTLRMDGQTINNLTLVPAGRRTQVQDTEGVIQSSKDADFLAKVADLQFDDGQGGTQIRHPERRTKIEYTDVNGLARKFEVTTNGAGRQWDPMDSYGVMIRIHCVEVSAS